jgi:enhancing lycopene biosynthesis protein 2
MNSFAKALGTLLNRTNATSVIGTTLASRSARRNYTTNKEAFRGRKRKIAIILAGCGAKDGSDPLETSSMIIHLSRHGTVFNFYAPNTRQHWVWNHFDNTPVEHQRHVLIESARLAVGGTMADINDLSAHNYDAVLIPGGDGVLSNLCTFTHDGPNMSVNSHVERVIHEFNRLKKPIGVSHSSGLLAAKCLPHITVAVGARDDLEKAIEQIGAKTIKKKIGEVHEDRLHHVISTPGFGHHPDAQANQVFEAIGFLIDHVYSAMHPAK